MSISHPPKPPNSGKTDCDAAVVSPDWAWLMRRFEKTTDDGFGPWIEKELSLLESELVEFASTSVANSRRS